MKRSLQSLPRWGGWACTAASRDLQRTAELPRAGKTAEVSVEADIYQITVEPGITITAARTTSRDIRRHKVSNYG